MIDLESFTDCISRIQEDCVEKKQEFNLKANECIEKILETLSEYNSKLEEVIQCKKAKETLNSPQTRLLKSALISRALKKNSEEY